MVTNTSNMNDLAESLNDASIDRLMAVGMNWEIISWNKMSELCTGIEKENILGKNLFEVFPQLQKDDEMLQAWKNVMKGFKSYLPARPGVFNRAHYENHFIPLIDKNGTLIGAMNIMHDVAHRIKAEKQLEDLNVALRHKYEQLEKANNELATFTSITGSELKTPIKHIYTSLEIIVTKDGQKLSDSSRAGLRRMQASLNRINLLLDDILALSSAGHSHAFNVVDMNMVLKNVLKLLQRKIEDKQAVIKSTTLPAIYGSAEMLQNLFYNILDNGLKFQLPDNIPHISISSSTVQPGIKGEKEFLCINFTDNGIGIPEQDRKRIFEMFHRLNERKEYAGSGIGLTISQKIAEAHEGFIEAESGPGMGTTIHCYLSTSLQQNGIKLSS